ncbi:peptidoglycan D,D-transpeptidase FtsI family protein [Verrucomicrobiota bacterium]
MNDRGILRRSALSGVFLTLAIIGLGVRLAFLHLGMPEKVRNRLQKVSSFEKKILANRGNIYDCRGRKNILALNLAVKDVCADPSAIVKCRKVDITASELAKDLELPFNDLASALNRPQRRFAYIKRFVHKEKIEEIKQKELTGVFFRDATIRYYPHKTFMSHVLGFVNHEGTGSAGVEQRMDKYLQGSPGFVKSQVNALREELYSRRDDCIPALEGADIFLTIDQNIQHMAEKALDELMAKHQAKGAWIIVERIKTGEILAMASRPTFDLNEFRYSDQASRLNRAVGYVYEPGSTFKAGVIAAALNEGVVTPETVIDCENGAWLYKGRILRDYHPYGKLTVADIIKKSSNIGTAKIALKLGEKQLYDYLKSFGIGGRLGIDLPGEECGILHPVRKWSNISSTRIAIGQGVAVTALQMLGTVCAIANDGVLMRPYVIKKVSRSDGIVLLKRSPEVLARPISPETAEIMRMLLSRVTEQGGTGRRAGIDGYRVAGKTGTAQKPVPGGYSNTDHMASFVGFLPAESPEIAAIVVVDTPQPSHTGGVVAAPAFKNIVSQIVRYLDIPPAKYRVAERRE